MSESAIRIGLVFPELLGTYGDSGNAVVLAQRLKWRGIGADIVRIAVDGAMQAATASSRALWRPPESSASSIAARDGSAMSAATAGRAASMAPG